MLVGSVTLGLKIEVGFVNLIVNTMTISFLDIGHLLKGQKF